MPISTSVVSIQPSDHASPFMALAVPEGPLPPSLAHLDAMTRGAIGRVYQAGDFAGKNDEQALVHADGPANRYLLIGLGKPEEASRARIRRAAAVAAKRARTAGVPTMGFYLSPKARGTVSARDAGQVIAEGLAYGAWHYPDLKEPPEDRKPPLERAVIIAPADAGEFIAGHAIGAAIAAGQTLTRGLQVLPGNMCPPRHLAEVATELGARHGIKVTVLDLPAIRKEGMGALLAVAQGSVEEPRFIVLEYQGAGGPPVVLVGKGVTFDTGGISIKPADKMEDMKYDMSGAAAVLGTFEMLGRVKPKVHVVGLIPSTENMPGGRALKPGDVIRSHLGKTIEIINTDAEGRLILCDALSYARRFQPACVLDAATLTGAVVVALGHVASGVLGTDDALIEEIRRAGDRADERVWPLPLWEEYRDLIKSDIADVKNTGGRPAGAISAAWFLREFVKDYPWAHIDIAGTAYSDKPDAAREKGPTGVAMRLFAEFVLGRAS